MFAPIAPYRRPDLPRFDLAAPPNIFARSVR